MRGSGVPLLPAAAFVVIWSSGYIAGPAGVRVMAPISLVGYRMLLAAVLLGLLARAVRGPLRVDRRTALQVGGVGLVMNGLQFGLMYLAFAAGLGATLGALLHSLSPVLTAVLAGLLLRERLSGVQVVGFALGVLGVLVVLGPDIDAAGGPVGLSLGLLSLASLSLGTLGQRWIGHGPDPLWSATIQFGVSAPPLLVLGMLLEGPAPVSDGSRAIVVVLYLAVVNSIAGLLLLGVLVRRAGAGAGGSVFFLMPPMTALLAWLVLGETLGPRGVVGLVVTVVGVAVATRPRRAVIGAGEAVS